MLAQARPICVCPPCDVVHVQRTTSERECYETHVGFGLVVLVLEVPC